DVAERLLEPKLRVLRNERARLVDALIPNQNLTGEDERLRLCAGLGQAAAHQERVEPFLASPHRVSRSCCAALRIPAASSPSSARCSLASPCRTKRSGRPRHRVIARR